MNPAGIRASVKSAVEAAFGKTTPESHPLADGLQVAFARAYGIPLKPAKPVDPDAPMRRANRADRRAKSTKRPEWKRTSRGHYLPRTSPRKSPAVAAYRVTDKPAKDTES